MKTFNYGDKYVKTLQVRVTADQLEFLEGISKLLGVSTSEYIRMLINIYLSSYKEGRNENKPSNSNDLV